jgi:hypothetical protein
MMARDLYARPAMRGATSCWLLAALAGCALNAQVGLDRPLSPATTASCAEPPVGRAGAFRRGTNRLVAKLGKPRHRGVDLIAVESDENQTAGGKLAYSSADADLEGEEVVVYGCVDDRWRELGRAITDNHGRFEIVLSGAARLPAGLRDLYVRVPADGSGVRFLAYVARLGESVIVSDLDGTLTESETAMVRTVLFGDDIGHRSDAPQVLTASGRTIVYVSSRGDQLTEPTRRWLREHGFPQGPLRLAPRSITRPGPRTAALKTATLRLLGLPIHAGIGNRRSDVEAYTNVGVPAHRIFIKLPEFQSELAPVLGARAAIGFSHYAELAPHL